MRSSSITPAGWPRPKGYSNAILVDSPRRHLFLAGQVAWNEKEEIVGEGDFVAQFRQVLHNIRTIVEEVGGVAENIVRLTIFVKDKGQYEGNLKGVGEAYRDVLGKHYPAMSLLEVKDLLEPGAMLEIEATAAMP